MTLSLYNTLTRRQEPFDPWDAEKISLGQPLTVVISTNFKDIYSNIKEQ